MNFTTAVRTCLNKYVTFDGRAPRSEFWWWVLFVIIANVVAVMIDSMIGIPAFQVIVGLGLLLPGIAVGVRRLHDLDKSGWWYLLVFIPIVGPLVLIFFFVQAGTMGSNRFGADPLS